MVNMSAKLQGNPWSHFQIFEHSRSEQDFNRRLHQVHSLQIWNSTSKWIKTAILHLRHTKLSAFWNLTVPYLTATHDHTQDGPTLTYVAVTLAFAHTSMHVCVHMYVHSRTTFTPTPVLTHTSRVHNRTYAHSRANTIYAHAHATTYTCAYIRTICHILTHTCSSSHIHVSIFAHSSSNTWYAHSCTRSRPLALLNAYSCTPTREHTRTSTLVHKHAHSRMHTPARTLLYTRAHAPVHAYSRTRPCACILVHAHLCMLTHARALVHACSKTRACAPIHGQL